MKVVTEDGLQKVIANIQERNCLEGHDGEILSIQFSPNGEIIASASDDKTVKIWDINGNLLQTFPEHDGNVMSVSFSPDSKTLVSGSLDTTVRLWQIDGKPVKKVGLDYLIMNGCDWLHDYLNTNPKVDLQEKKICDD